MSDACRFFRSEALTLLLALPVLTSCAGSSPFARSGQSAVERAPSSLAGAAWVTVSPGNFTMGSPGTEPGRGPDELPHSVTLTRSFDIQATDVTQAQWYQIMGNNPSVVSLSKYCPDFESFPDGMMLCPNNPVESVSWRDAQSFIQKLNAGSRDGYTYRLPTEAEWEYVARAGTQTAFFFGADPELIGANAWYVYNSDGRTHPVGSKSKNAWSVYDMAGEVLNWVQDCYAAYDIKKSTDPQVDSATCDERVIRGGSWWSSPAGCRSAARLHVPATLTSRDIGIRLVRTK